MSLAYKWGLFFGKTLTFIIQKFKAPKHNHTMSFVDESQNHLYKSVDMDINELKTKAKNLMIENKWDDLLIDAFLTTKHFVAWSKRDDFDECWNVGIKNVKGVQRNIDVSYINDETEFLSGELNGIHFQLGGVIQYLSMPDGDSFVTENLSLFIDDKRVIAVQYIMKGDGILPDDYSLFSVEEFHNHQSIEPLLSGIRVGKLEQKQKSRERERIENETKYQGKFSF